MLKKGLTYLTLSFLVLWLGIGQVYAQSKKDSPQWIRPETKSSQAVWGIKGGIVFSLWPAPVRGSQKQGVGSPRGLINLGYNDGEKTYLINYMAIEPVVNGKQEYSEVSPSHLDNRLGKLIWAGMKMKKFFPLAGTRGKITHPDPDHPEVEQLSLFLYMEKFLNGAHPYIKVTIRSDRPQEIGFQIFNHEDSAPMDRCTLTATMGNYSRIRLLYLKDKVINAGELYKGYEGLDFIEKEAYPAEELIKCKDGGWIAIAATNESFLQLSDWPQTSDYLRRAHWRYSPYFKVSQYWRKSAEEETDSLRVRVNGRAKYWSGGSRDPKKYINIPGGVSFENFEMREKYHSGEQFFFGITRKSPEEILAEWKQ